MTDTERTIQVPNPPPNFSHAPAGWADLIDEAIQILDREYPSAWDLLQIKEKFGGLRFYFKSHPERGSEAARQAIAEIEARSYQHCDVCGAPGHVVTQGYSRLTRCPEHKRAAGRDLAIVQRPVRDLASRSSGVWLVQTRRTQHIWDLDNMTYTRHPGPRSGAGSTRFDGNSLPITRVEAWPKVGESFFVWFDDPENPDLAEHYIISSTVVRITRHDGSESGE